MNIVLISLTFTILINVLLGLVVFVRNPKSAPNRALLYSALSLSIWALGNYFIDHSHSLLYRPEIQIIGATTLF